MARSHYEVLGVAPSAPHDAIRRAYLERARELHPDRYVDAGPQERASAQRAMQELNEAWRVLGNEGRRRRYDAEMVPAGRGPARWAHDDPRFTSRLDGTMPEPVEYLDPTARLVRGLPWIVLVVVLFAIFVFSAYAFTGRRGDTTVPPVPSSGCIAIGDGPSVKAVPCGSPGARAVVTQVSVSAPCPAGTERLQPASGAIAYCLEV